MEFKSEFYTKWEDFKKQNPDIADIKNAALIDEYEEGIVRFVLNLFVWFIRQINLNKKIQGGILWIIQNKRQTNP